MQGFDPSEGFGNLLSKLGVAVLAMLDPSAEVSKSIILNAGENRLLERSEVQPSLHQYLNNPNVSLHTTTKLFQLRAIAAVVQTKIKDLEAVENKMQEDIEVENKINSFHKSRGTNVEAFKTRNIMFDFEEGSTSVSVVLTFIKPNKMTIGDLLGKNAQEVTKIRKIYNKAYPNCVLKMCDYRFTYVDEEHFEINEMKTGSVVAFYNNIVNKDLSKVLLEDTIVKFSNTLPLQNENDQLILQNANLIPKMYVTGSYGNTDVPKYIDYVLSTTGKDLKYKRFFENWSIYEKVESIDNVYELSLRGDSTDLTTKLTDDPLKLKMLDDLSNVYIKAVELTGLAFTDLHTGNFGYDKNGNLKIIDYDNHMMYSPWPMSILRKFEDHNKNMDLLISYISQKLKNTIVSDIMNRYMYECYFDQHKDGILFGKDDYLIGKGISDLAYSRFLTTSRVSELVGSLSDRKILPMAHKSILLARAVKNLFGDNPTAKQLKRANVVWENYDAFNKESDKLKGLISDIETKKAIEVATIDSINVKNPKLIGYAAVYKNSNRQNIKF